MGRWWDARPARIAALAAAPLALASCATNAVRLDYAGDVAAQGRSTAAAADAFLGKVEDSRIAANIELAASDPNCLPLTAHVRQPPDLSRRAADGSPARGWLCAEGAEPGTVELSMAPLGRELAPTIELIGALGAYSDSVASILAGDGNAPAEDFARTLALLRAAAETAGAIGAVPGGAVPAADDPRIAAITGFVDFVTQLAAEQRKVKQLRELAGATTGSAELVATLEDHLGAWDLARRSDIALQSNLASSVMADAFATEPPPPADVRRELIGAYYARERGAREELRAYRVLEDLLASLAAADRDMRRVLAEKPELTREERALVARALSERVTRAFETATALLTAF